MKIEYLREFLVLAKTLNFSSAASSLFITQPALSRHISLLENAWGVPLFQRSTHGVTLTEFGAYAAEHISEIIQKYDSLLNDFSAQNSNYQGQLSIGLYSWINDTFIWEICNAFQNQYPNLKINFVSAGRRTMLKQLIDGELDILPCSRVEFPGAEKLRFYPFRRDYLCAFVSANSQFASLPELKLSDLHDKTFIFMKQSSEDSLVNDWTEFAFNKCNFTPKRIVYTDGKETVPYTISKTNGIHIGWKDRLTNDYPGIVSIPITEESFVFEMCFTHRRDNENPAIEVFRQFVQQFAPK